MKDASGSSHKSCYLQCRPVAVSRWRGNPRHTGPRRLIASLAAAGATQPDLRRPGALKITASCVQRPLRACHAHCLRPAALTLRPRRPRSARASRSGILHASPSLRWSDQLRARGKERSLRCASFRARLRHASASFAREKRAAFLRSFSRRTARLCASVQSTALTRPLRPAGGRTRFLLKATSAGRPAARATRVKGDRPD